MDLGQAAGYPNGTHVGTYVDHEGYMNPVFNGPGGMTQLPSPGGYSSNTSLQSSRQDAINPDCYKNLLTLGWNTRTAQHLCKNVKNFMDQGDPHLCARREKALIESKSTIEISELEEEQEVELYTYIDICRGAKTPSEEDCRIAAFKILPYDYFDESVVRLCKGAISLFPVQCAKRALTRSQDMDKAILHCNQTAVKQVKVK